MDSIRKFWPLDDDSDGEIYDNLAWDLPGFRPNPKRSQVKTRRKALKTGKPYIIAPS